MKNDIPLDQIQEAEIPSGKQKFGKKKSGKTEV